MSWMSSSLKPMLASACCCCVRVFALAITAACATMSSIDCGVSFSCSTTEPGLVFSAMAVPDEIFVTVDGDD